MFGSHKGNKRETGERNFCVVSSTEGKGWGEPSTLKDVAVTGSVTCKQPSTIRQRYGGVADCRTRRPEIVQNTTPDCHIKLCGADEL
jgi:hypothetical protein